MEAARTKRQDTYTVSYVLTGCVLVLCRLLLVEYGQFGRSLLATLALIMWAVFALLCFGVSLTRRRWRMAASILAAPILIGLVSSVAYYTGFSADEARLLVWKGDYLAEMASRGDNPIGIQIGIWPWRAYSAGLLVGTPEVVEFLVYDSSDQIILPRQSRSTDWFSSADKAGYDKSFFIHPELLWGNPSDFDRTQRVKLLQQHFYIVLFEI